LLDQLMAAAERDTVPDWADVANAQAWNAAGRDDVCIRSYAGQREWRVIVVTVL
jgi:hypothetical protein